MFLRTVASTALFSLFVVVEMASAQEGGSPASVSVSYFDSLITTAASAGTSDSSAASSSRENSPAMTEPHSNTAETASALAGSRAVAATSAPLLPAPATLRPSSREEFKPSGAAIQCSVIGYELNTSKPAMDILCPAKQISAPLRVYLKLAWKDVGDLSHFFEKKLVTIGGQANLRAKSGESKVELTLQNPSGEATTRHWFNVSVLSIGLANDGVR